MDSREGSFNNQRGRNRNTAEEAKMSMLIGKRVHLEGHVDLFRITVSTLNLVSFF